MAKVTQTRETVPAVTETVPAVTEPAHTVAAGHAVTTRRGILSGGETIYPGDVGSVESLAALVSLGVVV